jgi:hypothetical protein
MPLPITNKERLIRKLIFTPCKSKEDLHTWVKKILKTDLPDNIVVEESNSSPMDLLWEIYSKALANDDPNFHDILGFGPRGGYKSVVAAILQVAGILHLKRDSGIMAALGKQAKVVSGYLKQHFRKKYLKDFVVSENQEELNVAWWYNPITGDYLSVKTNEIEKLTAEEREGFKLEEFKAKVIIASVAACNSYHCVSGDSKTFIKLSEGRQDKNRERMVASVRGVFNQIAGLPAGGKPALIEKEELVILKPQKHVEIVSFNDTVGKFEWKKVVAGSRSFHEEGLEITCGDNTLKCSIDHKIYVMGKGYIAASEIKIGDRVLKAHHFKIDRVMSKSFRKKASYPEISEVVDNEWEQILVGTLMGDTGIYKKPMNNPYLRAQHCYEQADYMYWKEAQLSKELRFSHFTAQSGYTGEDMPGIQSGCSEKLLPYANAREALDCLDKIGVLALAVWYMDDGVTGRAFRLSTEGWNQEDNQKISDFINDRFGFRTKVKSYKKTQEDGTLKTYYCTQGGTEDKIRLQELCKKYSHPSMDYKFDYEIPIKKCQICSGDFTTYETSKNSKRCTSKYCRSINHGFDLIDVTHIKKTDAGIFYDLQVEDNNNFIANGILVHNCQLLIKDELDVLTDRAAYAESQYIPDPKDGQWPITFLTSTRKFSYGLVQEEIDKAHETGLIIRHWNIIDVTAKCEPSRHHPDLPQIDLYVDNLNIKHIEKPEYDLLDETTKNKYEKVKGFEGCKSCPIFAACKGRLATHQSSTSKLLKPITTIIQQFKKNSIETVNAQLLCRSPESTGLIYPRFSHILHKKTIQEIAQFIEEDTNITCRVKNKVDLIHFLQSYDVKFFAGIDWGYTHPYAHVVIAQWGKYAFVVDVLQETGLEDNDKAAKSALLRDIFDATIYADPESRSSIETFRKKGFNMRKWDKGKGSVDGGIGIVRTKLAPASGPPTLYLLKDDPGCELLATNIARFHYKTADNETIKEEPAEEYKDVNDALRYVIMNVFATKGGAERDFTSTKQQKPTSDVDPFKRAYSNWMKEIINRSVEDSEGNTSLTIKKKGFYFGG